MIEAFVFDLDGVITDTAYYHYIAWKELAKELNITIDEKFNETLKGISRLESLEKILKLGKIENNFNIKEKEDLANKKNEKYVSLIDKLNEKDILPGIKELLDDIRSEGLKIGLASASKNAKKVLKNLKLIEYFDYIADANECKRSKPAPDIFIMASDGLNVAPQKCIGIEDSSAGIEAINSINMYSVGVGNYKNLSKANYLVDNTKNLKFEDIVKKYNEYKNFK